MSSAIPLIAFSALPYAPRQMSRWQSDAGNFMTLMATVGAAPRHQSSSLLAGFSGRLVADFLSP